MIGLSTDYKLIITGLIRGVVMRLERILVTTDFHIWCGFHKLDLVVQSVFEASFD